MILGLRTEDLPTGRALEELEDFFRDRQPLPLETQELSGNEQPPMEAQPDQLRRERVDRDLRSLLATCTDEYVCLPGGALFPEVSGSEIQGPAGRIFLWPGWLKVCHVQDFPSACLCPLWPS